MIINWSNLQINRWADHPFWKKRELKDLKEVLIKTGMLGSHWIVGEGYSEESISYSEGTIDYVGNINYTDIKTFWIDLLDECDSISPQGFDYPLNRAAQSNAKQGYKSAINNKKAGELFVATIFEMLEELLYEYDSINRYECPSYRIKPWAFKVVEAMGHKDNEIDRNDNEVTIGTLSWEIEIDPMGIYEDVEE